MKVVETPGPEEGVPPNLTTCENGEVLPPSNPRPTMWEQDLVKAPSVIGPEVQVQVH